MTIYLLLIAGLFMGWSLGTNDAANAFGTAVATRVIKFRTAVIIIAVLVVIGALLQGEGNIGKLSELAQSLGVKNSVVLWPVRVAVSGRQSTPGGATDLCTLLGKDEALSRIRRGIDLLRAE